MSGEYILCLGTVYEVGSISKMALRVMVSLFVVLACDMSIRVSLEMVLEGTINSRNINVHCTWRLNKTSKLLSKATLRLNNVCCHYCFSVDF